MPRSSIAAATGPPLAAGSSTRTQIASGAVPVGEQVLGFARHGLRLGPLVAAAPEADGRIAEHLFQDERLRLRVRRGEGGCCGASPSSTPPPPRDPQRRRLPRRGGSGSPSRADEDRALGRRRLLELVDHQVREAGCDLGSDVGPLVQQLVEGEEDVAAVEAAGLGEDAVVGGAELGQLRLGRLGAGLQLVDLAEQAGEQPGRVAADLVAAQGKLVETVEEHRQALGRAEDVEEGIETGGRRVLAQEPLADRLPGADPELLERIARAGFRRAPAGAARRRDWRR